MEGDPCSVCSEEEIWVKRKASKRPGKLKRMRMRSLKEKEAGSNVEELVGTPLSQPTPGPSGVRNDFGGESSGPQQEDGSKEVVMIQEEDEVFLDEEVEEEEKEPKKKRMSAALKFSWRVIERPPKYNELIEGVPQNAFPEDLDMKLEIPWEERFF